MQKLANGENLTTELQKTLGKMNDKRFCFRVNYR